MSLLASFRPEPPLLPGFSSEQTRACVVIPVRNEENTLAATLDALLDQRDHNGRLLDWMEYEVLVLLNNCTDQSDAAAQAWKRRHPGFLLQIVERILPGDLAHVGWARRLAMDTAWHRLHGAGTQTGMKGILSTDADTLVHPRWVAANLQALERGADAVGGAIHLQDEGFARLSSGVQRAYRRDRRYQLLVAKLEDLLDPQAGDPWPRHLEHFGASLACSPEAYARAGGLPPVKLLEDVAFVDALRRSGARLRHDPSVIVATSARLDGRAEIGLSHQLRTWQVMTAARLPQKVVSAEALTHRFRTMRHLRAVFAGAEWPQSGGRTCAWQARLREERGKARSEAEFLFNIDCDRMIRESGPAVVQEEIAKVNRRLARSIAQLRWTRQKIATCAADQMRVLPWVRGSATATMHADDPVEQHG